MQQTVNNTTAIPTAAQAFMQKQREQNGKVEAKVEKAPKVKVAKSSKYADYSVAELEESMKRTNEKLAKAKASNNASDIKKYTERLETQSKFFNDKKTAK